MKLWIQTHSTLVQCVRVRVCACLASPSCRWLWCLLKTCRCTPLPPLAPSSPPLLSSLVLCERGKEIGRRSSHRLDNPSPTSPDSCYSARYWSPLELSVNTVWVHQSINNILMFHIAMNRYQAGLIGAAKNKCFCLLMLSIDNTSIQKFGSVRFFMFWKKLLAKHTCTFDQNYGKIVILLQWKIFSASLLITHFLKMSHYPSEIILIC